MFADVHSVITSRTKQVPIKSYNTLEMNRRKADTNYNYNTFEPVFVSSSRVMYVLGFIL